MLPSVHVSGVYTKAAGSLFSLVRLGFRLTPARLPQVVQERALTGTVRILLSFQFFYWQPHAHFLSNLLEVFQKSFFPKVKLLLSVSVIRSYCMLLLGGTNI